MVISYKKWVADMVVGRSVEFVGTECLCKIPKGRVVGYEVFGSEIIYKVKPEGEEKVISVGENTPGLKILV